MADHTVPHRQRPEVVDVVDPGAECLRRLRAIRAVCDGFVEGNWLLDSGLLLMAAELLDQAGAWCMVVEETRRRKAA